jgi:hypothetical protein
MIRLQAFVVTKEKRPSLTVITTLVTQLSHMQFTTTGTPLLHS